MWRRALGLVLCGLVLYGVAPAVLDVLDAWPQVVDIELYWFAAMVLAQVLSWASMWLLQRLAVDARSWWPVVTSQLASGALGRVVPGGPAAAGALQYRMLVVGRHPVVAGRDRDRRRLDRPARDARRAAGAGDPGGAARGRGPRAAVAGRAARDRRVRRAARDRGDAAGLRPRGRVGRADVDPDRHGGCGRASRRPPTCRNAGATSATSSGRRSDGAGGRPSRAARGAGCSTG